MITTKQRAQLRGLANGISTILQVGKSGVTEATVQEAELAIAARELIKGRVLENAPVTPREAAQQLAAEINADVVQVIGTRFVLYRPSKKPAITLKA